MAKNLLETTLPATLCTVHSAEITAADNGYCLRIEMSRRAQKVKEILLGDDLVDLISQLTTKLGFDARDANRIVAFARSAS